MDRTRILMFHRLEEPTLTAFGRTSCRRLRGTSVSWGELDAWVGSGPVVRLETIIEALHRSHELPSGTALTFDDGYAEWAELGKRLIERGWPASFFACDAMRSHRPLHPIDAYYAALDGAQRPQFRIDLPDGSSFEADLTSDRDKLDLVTSGPKQWVMDARHGASVAATVARAAESNSAATDGRALYVSDDQLSQLVGMGHGVEHHSRSHLHLDTLSVRVLKEEVVRPTATTFFSYPDGVWNETVRDAVVNAGYRAALTCEPRDVNPGDDPFALGRWFAHCKASGGRQHG